MDISSLINIEDRFNLDEMYIYNAYNCFKPFINRYLKSDIKCDYKLLHGYIFQYNLVKNMYKERSYVKNNPQYINQRGQICIKKNQVRKDFYDHNVSYFIGYTYLNNPIFIHLSECYDKNYTEILFYSYTGFMQIFPDNKDDTWRYSDKKDIGKIKNLHVDNLNFSDWYENGEWVPDPFKTIIEKTQKENEK